MTFFLGRGLSTSDHRLLAFSLPPLPGKAAHQGFHGAALETLRPKVCVDHGTSAKCECRNHGGRERLVSNQPQHLQRGDADQDVGEIQRQRLSASWCNEAQNADTPCPAGQRQAATYDNGGGTHARNRVKRQGWQRFGCAQECQLGIDFSQ